MSRPLHLTIHGARGSIPVSGPGTVRYGGATTCLSVDGLDEPVVFDCGTGLVLAPSLHREAPTRFHIFLTHFHLDHLQGLQLFAPLFASGNHLVFHGRPPQGVDLAEAVGAPFAGPLFPVRWEDTAAEKSFVVLGEGTPVPVGPLRVTPIPLRHPQGATGYRIDGPTTSAVIATDHEAGDPGVDAHLRSVAAGAGTLIHDAQYTVDELDDRSGFGHSSWRDAASCARAAGVERLVLTSHDPYRSDDDIDAIVEMAAHNFPSVSAAHEGMQIPL